MSDEFNTLENLEDKRGSAEGKVSDVLPDIQNHPNMRLLPEVCGNIGSDRILGGTRTTLLEMPWMVLLSYFTGM